MFNRRRLFVSTSILTSLACGIAANAQEVGRPAVEIGAGFSPLFTIPASAAPGLSNDGDTNPATKPAPSSPSAAEFLPMTRSERLRNYLRTIGSREILFRTVVSASIRQKNNSPKEWEGHAEGFGYRVGDVFARNLIRKTLESGAALALHEDNRYFVSGQTGTMRRVKYAVASTFLARHDNGQRTLSISQLGGAAGGAFISTIWQPRSTTTMGDGAVSFGVTMGSDVGFNLFREFWPDVKRHFKKGSR